MRSTRARAGARRNGRPTAPRCVRYSDLHAEHWAVRCVRYSGLHAEHWAVYQRIRRQGDLHSQYVAQMRANPADIDTAFPQLSATSGKMAQFRAQRAMAAGRRGSSAEPMTTVRRLDNYSNDGRQRPSARQGRQLERMYQRECRRNAGADA